MLFYKTLRITSEVYALIGMPEQLISVLVGLELRRDRGKSLLEGREDGEVDLLWEQGYSLVFVRGDAFFELTDSRYALSRKDGQLFLNDALISPEDLATLVLQLPAPARMRDDQLNIGE